MSIGKVCNELGRILDSMAWGRIQVPMRHFMLVRVAARIPEPLLEPIASNGQ